MSKLAESIRQKVRERAGNRCEYCLSHQDYVMGWLQIDHVYPVSKGGLDTEDNLCLAQTPIEFDAPLNLVIISAS